MTQKESLLPSLSLWGKPALRRFRSDLDTLVEEFFNDFLGSRNLPASVFEDLQPKGSFPKINVSENDDGYNVEIAVAGFGKDDVKLELKDNTLMISAEKKEEEEESDTKILRREISYRSFQRAVRFPCEVDANKAEAGYKDGIISFKIEKKREEDPKTGVTIEIN
jgi:HSP20 family protein